VGRRPVRTFRNGRGRYPNLFILEDGLLRDDAFVGGTRNDRPAGRRMQSFPFALDLQCVLRRETLEYAN